MIMYPRPVSAAFEKAASKFESETEDAEHATLVNIRMGQHSLNS
jgi:hypothetical protein